MSQSPREQVRSALLPQIAVLTVTRTVINTGFRMVYPLLPVFARGVGVDVATFAIVLTILQLLGLTAPIFGQVSERQGKRFTMLFGLGLYIAGMIMVFISPDFIGFSAALIIASLGKIAFDPAVQAYIGDRVPYEKRGLYMGMLEFGWSGAFIIGVPIMSFLIATSNWQAPFAVLAVVTGIVFLVSLIVLDADKPEKIKQASFLQGLKMAVNSPVAIAGLFLGGGISAANQLVSVVFGLWIEDSFGIQLTALAVASFVIGLSELSGEGIVTTISDRFGKRRLIIVSIIGNILACLILPFTAINLTTALFGLFLFYLTFEIALVSTIPLASELNPASRSIYLSVYIAAVTFGRTIVTPLAPMLFSYGLLANTLAAIVFNLVAITAVWRFIQVD